MLNFVEENPQPSGKQSMVCARCMVVPNKICMLPDCSSYKHIIQKNFTPLLVLTTAFAGILYFEIEFSAIRQAVVIGLIQSLVVIVGTRMMPVAVMNRSWWQLLFLPRPVVSLAALLLTFVGFLAAVFLRLPVVGAADSVLVALMHVLAGFSAGTAVAWLLDGLLLSPRPTEETPHFKIEPDYIQIFAAAVIAAAFLGITLVNVRAFDAHWFAYAPVFIPLIYGVGSVCTALLAAYLTDKQGKSRFALPAGLLTVLLLGWFAYGLVDGLFPAFWVKNGKEYTARQFVDIWWLAIAAGYLAGNVEKIYRTAAQRYIDYLLNRPARHIAYNVLLRVVINHFIAYLPTVTMIALLAYAYANGGIYGAALAVLGAVSNLGTGKIAIGNALQSELLDNLTDGAKRKLRLLSPPVSELFRKNGKINLPEAA